MNCKNCITELSSSHKYCYHCGAKVVTERITIKSLIYGLLISLGWDNQIFVTLRDLIIKPQVVFEKYLNGTRKRYTNPFTLFAIGAALSVLFLGFYSDKLINISTQASLRPAETILDNYPEGDNTSELSKEQEALLENLQAINKSMVSFMFKYYNYLSFLLLPFYAIIALLIYGKPNNYGEHLVINAYIQGLLFFFGLLLFLLSMLFRKDLYTGGAFILTVIVYLYTYKKYRKQTIDKTVVSLLKFIGIILGVFIILMILGVLIGMFFIKP